MESPQERAGLACQVGVWDRMSDVYVSEIDPRFAPVERRPASLRSVSRRPGRR